MHNNNSIVLFKSPRNMSSSQLSARRGMFLCLVASNSSTLLMFCTLSDCVRGLLKVPGMVPIRSSFCTIMHKYTPSENISFDKNVRSERIGTATPMLFSHLYSFCLSALVICVCSVLLLRTVLGVALAVVVVLLLLLLLLLVLSVLPSGLDSRLDG